MESGAIWALFTVSPSKLDLSDVSSLFRTPVLLSLGSKTNPLSYAVFTRRLVDGGGQQVGRGTMVYNLFNSVILALCKVLG